MKIIYSIFAIFLFLSFSSFAFAADPSFSLRPGSGKVKLNTEFVVDILIDTKGKDVALARAVLKYDPLYVTVQKAERNASLFCSYPEDEQSIDNEQGLLMITGFCQSGSGTPYKTSGAADVLARVTFKAIKVGNIALGWQYDGEDVPFMSVIMKDGSPPQNALLTKPKDGAYTTVRTVVKPPVDTGNTPSTGYSISIGLVLSGILLTMLGFIYVKWSETSYKSKLRTVVVYGNKK